MIDVLALIEIVFAARFSDKLQFCSTTSICLQRKLMKQLKRIVGRPGRVAYVVAVRVLVRMTMY